jgi:hypothetical protein
VRRQRSPADEERLRAILERVSPADAETLLAFGEFLAARASQAAGTGDTRQAEAGSEPASQPVGIPRPEAESVMQALKRLSATYPMLDRKKLLDATSTLVMQHLAAGRDRVEVIDELEIVFRREYEKL